MKHMLFRVFYLLHGSWTEKYLYDVKLNFKVLKEAPHRRSNRKVVTPSKILTSVK